MADNDTILERVRKLLALAGSPNPHEAAAAAATAQTLIARHRLQEWLDADAAAEDEAEPIEDARDAPLEVARKPRRWKVALAATLADANHCLAYTLDRGHERAIVLVGRAADRAAVLELWTWLVGRIEWLSATHGAGADRKWHDAFRIGVVTTIGERLAAVEAEVRSELDAGALVRLDPVTLARRDALDRFVRERMQLGKGRSIRVDAQAYAAGRAAGATLDLGAGERAGGTGRALRKRR
ncbi:MAG: hypothetical protein RIT45_2803 [Pseudomonadota bacterium]